MIWRTSIFHGLDGPVIESEYDELEALKEFVRHLKFDKAGLRITGIAPTRITTEFKLVSGALIVTDVFEGPEHEMDLLHEVATRHIRAQDNPVFSVIKDHWMIELAAGIPRKEICAN